MANVMDGRSVDDGRTPSVEDASHAVTSAGRSLTLATISFALSFAAWGLVGGLASVFTGLYKLTASQTALLVAVPVLLGSLARLPMGMLTDRFGGRARLRRTACLLVARRFSRAAHRELSVAACRRLPDRHGGIVVRRRRGLRLAVDPGGSARHRPGDLRAGHDGAVTRRVCRTGRSRAIRLGGGVSGNERVARCFGRSSISRSPAIPPQAVRPASVAAMIAVLRRAPNGVAARRLLLPHVRRVRRVFHLSADAAAGAVRPRAGRRRLSRRRLRRPRDAHAARRWVAGGSHRRRAGAVLGVRRRRPVCAAADLAVHGAVHGRRARRARC